MTDGTHEIEELTEMEIVINTVSKLEDRVETLESYTTFLATHIGKNANCVKKLAVILYEEFPSLSSKVDEVMSTWTKEYTKLNSEYEEE